MGIILHCRANFVIVDIWRVGWIHSCGNFCILVVGLGVPALFEVIFTYLFKVMFAFAGQQYV